MFGEYKTSEYNYGQPPLASSLCVQAEKAERLFAKIDWSSLQEVSWNEFCTFLQMQFKIKELGVVWSKMVEFYTPAPHAALPHRDSGLCVMDTADGLWITVSIVSTRCRHGDEGTDRVVVMVVRGLTGCRNGDEGTDQLSSWP